MRKIIIIHGSYENLFNCMLISFFANCNIDFYADTQKGRIFADCSLEDFNRLIKDYDKQNGFDLEDYTILEVRGSIHKHYQEPQFVGTINGVTYPTKKVANAQLGDLEALAILKRQMEGE